MMGTNSIWDEMNRFRRRMNRLFGGDDFFEEDFSKPEDYRRAQLRLDEDDKNYFINVEIPGVKKEDIKLNVLDGGVEVKASISREEKKEKEGERHYFKSHSGFYRFFNTPSNADLDKIDASYKNGLLRITIPKKEKKGRELKIN